jgi:hypothetical protein
LKAAEGAVSDVESAIWILLVGHIICRPGEEAGRSNEDGWPDTTNASSATNARIGFGRRIRELNVKSFRERRRAYLKRVAGRTANQYYHFQVVSCDEKKSGSGSV